MIYKYDSKQLMFKKNFKVIYVSLGLLLVALFIAFFIGRKVRLNDLSEYEKELIVLNIQQEKNKFTEEKFIVLINELNLRYPHIVMAQALLESGNYKSKIFTESNNLFGMKQAKVRINTAKGTQYNHAYYDSWKESVYDYAFYSCRYLHHVQTENEYYAALDASYAEASQYSETLKGIVEKRGLKKLFK